MDQPRPPTLFTPLEHPRAGHPRTSGFHSNTHLRSHPRAGQTTQADAHAALTAWSPFTCLLSLFPTRSDFFQGCPQACPGLTRCRSSSVPPILNRTATSAQPYPAELQHTPGHPWDPRMWQGDMLFFQGRQLPQVRSLSCSSGPRPGTPSGEWQASF